MSLEALDLNELPFEVHALDSPPLEEIAAAIRKKLCENFQEVSTEVIDCPNLTEEPYNLAAKGLGGNPVLIELGGPAFLLPLVHREKIYDLRTLPKLVGDEDCFVIGAGAGPWPYAGVNCEGVFNVVLNEDKIITSGTRISKIDANQKLQTEVLPASEYRSCLMANLFCSRGETCKVVKVCCKKRTGKLDFVSPIRLALAESFPGKFIGVGGVFVLRKGKAWQHVMPGFAKIPIDTDEKLYNWLNFHDMSAPLTALGTLVSKDPGLDLRVSHFHSFNKTEAGHYHHDTTPDEAEYVAILATGCTLARVDPPSINDGLRLCEDKNGENSSMMRLSIS